MISSMRQLVLYCAPACASVQPRTSRGVSRCPRTPERGLGRAHRARSCVRTACGATGVRRRTTGRRVAGRSSRRRSTPPAGWRHPQPCRDEVRSVGRRPAHLVDVAATGLRHARKALGGLRARRGQRLGVDDVIRVLARPVFACPGDPPLPQRGPHVVARRVVGVAHRTLATGVCERVHEQLAAGARADRHRHRAHADGSRGQRRRTPAPQSPRPAARRRRPTRQPGTPPPVQGRSSHPRTHEHAGPQEHSYLVERARTRTSHRRYLHITQGRDGSAPESRERRSRNHD